MAEADFQTFTSIMDALVRISLTVQVSEEEEEGVHSPPSSPIGAAEAAGLTGHPELSSIPSRHCTAGTTESPNLSHQAVTPQTPDRTPGEERVQLGTYPGRRRREGPPPAMLFPCPSCQRDVELGERGLSDCLRNLTLERIVERYRHTVSLGAGAVMCQFCKPPAQLEATKGCTDCRASFCNECFKLYHPWGTPRAQHEHVAPTLSFRPKVLTCPEHDQEKLHFYCKSCQRLLCPLCKLRRAHAGHKITPVANAYQALKVEITKSVGYILSNQETVQSQITQLEAAITQTEMNSGSAREQLCQSVRELCAALTDRQGVLLQALDGARLRRVEALTVQVTERQSLLEHAGLLAFSQELLKETEPPCFLQAARLIPCFFVFLIVLFPALLSSLPVFLSPKFFLSPFSELSLSRSLLYLLLLSTSSLSLFSFSFSSFLPLSLLSLSLSCLSCLSLSSLSPSPVFPASFPSFSRWKSPFLLSPSSALSYLSSSPLSLLLSFLSLPLFLSLLSLLSVLNFFLDSRWGFHGDRLVLGKEQRGARSVPGVPLLQAADRALTSCHLTSDLLIGDVAVTQGRHYWACAVDPGSYVVKVGVGLEARLQEWFHLPQDMASPRYDPDSGHDSGAEDATLDSPPPFCFLTVGMGKVLLPQGVNNCPSNATSPRDPPSQPPPPTPHSPPAITAPLPPRLGVCLDFEKGRVSFYDGVSLRLLWEGPVDCSAPVCPAFCFIGGGALQVQELVANRSAEQPPPRRVTIQSRAVTNLGN
uniref:Tripartite motif containing 46a n=1 Tax=Lepisosteus oculatus TaxID=7918 RepID=W5MIL5_LEPOC